MAELLSRTYVKYGIITAYTLALGYCFGRALIWVLPSTGLAWPYSLIPGYALGLVLAVLIALCVLRLRLSRDKKMAIAAFALFVAVISSHIVTVNTLSDAKLRAAEVFEDSGL